MRGAPPAGERPGHPRGFNRRLVLEAIRLQGPISRGAIARATGLSLQTISNIADELLTSGLLREQGVRQGGRGAPAVDLALDPDAGFTFGISYGVLFPFGAMNHPANETGGTTFDYGSDPDTGSSNVGDASTAHTIQSRLLLTF